MLYREIIAVCSQIHTKHINTAVWAELGIAEFYTGHMYSDQWALKRLLIVQCACGLSVLDAFFCYVDLTFRTRNVSP
jgi:hypothetical protein